MPLVATWATVAIIAGAIALAGVKAGEGLEGHKWQPVRLMGKACGMVGLIASLAFSLTILTGFGFMFIQQFIDPGPPISCMHCD